MGKGTVQLTKLKLNSYLVSINKISIKRVRGSQFFLNNYKVLASVLTNLCSIEIIAAYSS